MAVVAGQSHQDAGGTAALLLTTQTAVTHLPADGARPCLERKSPNLMWVTNRKTPTDCDCLLSPLV